MQVGAMTASEYSASAAICTDMLFDELVSRALLGGFACVISTIELEFPTLTAPELSKLERDAV